MQSLAGEPFFSEAVSGTNPVKEGFINSDGGPYTCYPMSLFALIVNSFSTGWVILPPVKGFTLDEQVANTLTNVEDKDKLTEFLRKCLRINPRDRASASELMNVPWLASG